MKTSLRASQHHRETGTLLTFDLNSGSVNATDVDDDEDYQNETTSPSPASNLQQPAVTTSSRPPGPTFLSPSEAPTVEDTDSPSSFPSTQTQRPQDILTAVPQDDTASDANHVPAHPQEHSETALESGVLKSLRLYDDLRARAPEDFQREDNDSFVNVDILPSPEGDVAFCHLSSIIPFTFGDNAPWLTAFEDAAAIALAAHHLNAGDGTLVPEVEGLNERCNVRFTAEFADTEFAGGVAVNRMVEQSNREPGSIARNPCAFIGAYRSAVSIPMSIVSGVLGYPQVTGVSTSPDLDDTDQYPMFARTIPSDAGNAIPVIRYIREVFGVKHMAVINVNDAYGNAFVQGLRRGAELFAPDMDIHQIPLDDDPSSIPAAVQSLVETEYRFVFAIVFTQPTHDALLEEAYNQGAAGTGKHTWLFGDSFLGTLDGRTFPKDGPLHKAYQGAGLFEVTNGINGMPKYDKFVNEVAKLKNPTDLDYLGSLFPRNDHPDYAAFGTPPYIGEEDFLFQIASGWAPFMYEAIIATGLAACSAGQEQLNFTGQDHFAHIKNTTFTGFSGSVVFDPDTGTRIPSSAMYKVTNYVAEDVVDEETGESAVRFKPVITDLFAQGNWSERTDFIFNDGTPALPNDLPPPVTAVGNDNGVSMGLMVGIPIAVIAILGVIVFLFYENKRKKNDSVWKVSKDELNFGANPEIIGRGTFGLILLAEFRGTQVAVKRVIPPRTEKNSKQNDRTSTGIERTDSVISGDSSGISGDSSGISGDSSGISAGTSSHGSNTSGGDGPDKTAGNLSGLGSSFRSHSHTTSSGLSRGTESGIFGNPAAWAMSGAISGVGTMLTGAKKRSKFARVQNEAAIRRKLKQEFISEMRYLSKLRHPCITTVMGAVTVGEPMLVMEYMDHGSLYDLLHNETMVLEGELLLPILKDITQGVRFLHSADPQVLHGDLKAANVLVDSRFRGKVADFGLSQKKNLGGTGTPFWMAPELLRMETTNTPASDIYSMGIILYEVYSRRDPYEGEDATEVLRLVADKAVQKRPPIPKYMPDQLRGLMADCLEEVADRRPSFEELDMRLKRVDAKTVDPGQVVNKTISLFDIFPRNIAEALRDGRTVEPEHKESVCIFFSDIVGFTDMSSTLDPRKVASMLDRLYTKFDNLTHNVHDIFKVETIGDAYMCVTNLVKEQSEDHVKRIAEFAIDAIQAANSTLIDEEDPDKGYVNIRVGFHAGPVVADVVGTRNPRYCLFGDTVNTSSRMESNSEVNRIHCSNDAAKILHKQCPSMRLNSRGRIHIKGKGEMKTWWVNEESENRRSSKDYPQSSEEFVLDQKFKIGPLHEEPSGEFASSDFLKKEADIEAAPEAALF